MNLGLKLYWKALWVCVLAIVFAGCLRAKDITGNWQGTITPPQGAPRRMVLRVVRDESGALKARIYSIDQGPTGNWTDSFTVKDSTVTFVVGMLQLSYKGKLGPDGNSIIGTWTQGSPLAFNLQKSTKATAWALPTDPAHHSVQFVTVEPGVNLEVLELGRHRTPTRVSHWFGRHRACIRQFCA
jgi:hypothetical protein